MALSLRMTVDGTRHLTFDGEEHVLVGRDPRCDVVIGDRLVSREHLVFERRGHGWSVVDTSSNGTYAGGSRMEARDLVAGQPMLLRLGDEDSGPAVGVEVAETAGGTDGNRAEFTVAGAPVFEAANGVVAEHDLAAGTVSIGRLPGNTVVLDDLLVSRHHATVTMSGPGVAEVRHLGGRNGTFVNGRPVIRQVITQGDRLTVGRFSFTFDGGTALLQLGGTVRTALSARDLTVRYGESRVLDGVSLTVPPGSLVAVIGPSGAGKSTLLRALTGICAADEGQVLVDGIDFYPAYDELRHRIGLVPQDDVLHDQLTVRQALRYAAALRLPDDVPSKERDRSVEAVIGQLDLTGHADRRIDRLSGGQRKRASVAMELLTEPSLLYLDEPTSGLDPLLDREVMRRLRELADRGRTVLVVTHSTANLDACHQVVAMARGGRVAYAGPPAGLLAYFGVRDYADVFAALTEEATAWAGHYQPAAAASAPARPVPQPVPPRQSALRQVGLLLRRQARLLLADRRQQIMMLATPVALAGVTQTTPPDSDLVLKPGTSITGAATLLVTLIIGAAFMGMAGTVREFVAERSVYRRERTVGLRSGAYLASKVIFCAALCAVQAPILGFGGLIGREVPVYGLVLANARLELVVVLAVTAFAGGMAGLLAGSLAKRSEHTMPVLVGAIMAQLVLSGGLFGIGGRPWLQAAAVISPTRWAYSAAAATVDLRTFHVVDPADAMWRSAPANWWHMTGMTAVLGLVFVGASRLVLRAQESRPR